MATKQMRSEEELTKMAKHKGRAYMCNICVEQPFADTKNRFHGHYMKYHAKLNELPYFCSLCNFRCLEKKQLIDHIYAYKLHRQMAKDKKY